MTPGMWTRWSAFGHKSHISSLVVPVMRNKRHSFWWLLQHVLPFRSWSPFLTGFTSSQRPLLIPDTDFFWRCLMRSDCLRAWILCSLGHSHLVIGSRLYRQRNSWKPAQVRSLCSFIPDPVLLVCNVCTCGGMSEATLVLTQAFFQCPVTDKIQREGVNMNSWSWKKCASEWNVAKYRMQDLDIKASNRATIVIADIFYGFAFYN